MFSPLTQQLFEALSALPGIGPKSAQRMGFYLLQQKNRPKGMQLSKILEQALSQVGNCTICQTYTEEPLCSICSNNKRNHQQICIIESPADILAIEQTQCYRGMYHVLHGHLSPLDGIGPEDIGIPALLQRLNDNPIEEIILATNPTMEGKATAHYIASHLPNQDITISRIAFGVPLGGEIEYLDGHTLSHAFQSRLTFTHNDTTT